MSNLKRPESTSYSWRNFTAYLKGRFKNSPALVHKSEGRPLVVKATGITGGAATDMENPNQPKKSCLKGSIPTADIILLVLPYFSCDGHLLQTAVKAGLRACRPSAPWASRQDVSLLCCMSLESSQKFGFTSFPKIKLFNITNNFLIEMQSVYHVSISGVGGGKG